MRSPTTQNRRYALFFQVMGELIVRSSGYMPSGHGKTRAALVIGTPETLNEPKPTEAEPEVLRLTPRPGSAHRQTESRWPRCSG
jgi:hypothetical protein